MNLDGEHIGARTEPLRINRSLIKSGFISATDAGAGPGNGTQGAGGEVASENLDPVQVHGRTVIADEPQRHGQESRGVVHRETVPKPGGDVSSRR